MSILPWIILLVGGAVYFNSLSGVFVFDDFASIANNPAIRHLWPPAFLFDCPPERGLSGRPAVSFSFALNYALHDFKGPGYHLLNIVLHLLCGLLLFAILKHIFQSSPLVRRYGAYSSMLAFAVSLLWVVHPLTTEAVTYLSSRSELLMGFFYLATFYCSFRVFRSEKAPGWEAAAVAACALGMVSKEVMVSAPLIVFLSDRVFFSGSWREALRRRPAFYRGLAVTLGIMIFIVASGPRGKSVGFNLPSDVTARDYLLTQSGVILHYLRLAFWPDPLVIDYFDWPIARALSEVIIPASIVLCGLAATLWLTLKNRPAGMLGVWFFFILAPTSSFVPIPSEVAAEFRMYLPLCAVLTAAVLAGWELLRRFSSSSVRKYIAPVLLGAAVLCFGFLTVRQNALYTTEVAVLEHTVKYRPGNSRARLNLVFALYHEGRLEEAAAHAREAVRTAPDNLKAKAHTVLGMTLEKSGKREEAGEAYRRALEIDPGFPRARDSLKRLVPDPAVP